MPKRITKTPCLGGIYRITCLEGDLKSYIGSTKQRFYQRWNQHRSCLNNKAHSNVHLQSAWNKYGSSSFEFCELESVAFAEDLIGCEQKWIDLYQAFNRNSGFNVMERADRRCLSEETKAKLSASHKGKKRSPEAVAKTAAANRGRKRPPEAIAKTAAARRGSKMTPEAIAKIVAFNTGKKHSPETIAKMSASHKGKKQTPEHIAKLADQRKGSKMSPESVAKMSATRTGKKQKPEHVKNSVAANIKINPFFYRAAEPNGTIHTILNLRAFCRDFKLCSTGMCQVASGVQKHHKGWTCQKLLKSEHPEMLPSDQPSTFTPKLR